MLKPGRPACRRSCEMAISVAVADYLHNGALGTHLAQSGHAKWQCPSHTPNWQCPRDWWGFGVAAGGRFWGPLLAVRCTGDRARWSMVVAVGAATTARVLAWRLDDRFEVFGEPLGSGVALAQLRPQRRLAQADAPARSAGSAASLIAGRASLSTLWPSCIPSAISSPQPSSQLVTHTEAQPETPPTVGQCDEARRGNNQRGFDLRSQEPDQRSHGAQDRVLPRRAGRARGECKRVGAR